MTLFASLYPKRVNKLVYLDAAYDRTKMFTCADELPAEIAPPAAIRMMREAMNCPGWADIVVKDMPAADVYNVQVSTMRSARTYRPEYKKVTAPALSIYADPEVAQFSASLTGRNSQETGHLLERKADTIVACQHRAVSQRDEKCRGRRDQRLNALCIRRALQGPGDQIG